MKKLIVLACLALMVSAPVFAGSQQEKMKGCNAEAKSNTLKGEARRAFMSKCLKKDYVLKNAPARAGAKATPAVLPDKQKTCTAEAASKSLNGEARTAFMKKCLKS